MSATAIRDEQEIEQTMNAIILYDDFVLAAKADAILGRAARRAEEAVRWNVKPLRVNLLTLDDLADAALTDAADAHLLVLALRQPEQLPVGLGDWLERWAALRQVADVALAVFDGGNGDALSASVSSALSQFAERHGLSFIPAEAQPVAAKPAGILDDLHEREVATTSTLHEILKERDSNSYRGWGINE